MARNQRLEDRDSAVRHINLINVNTTLPVYFHDFSMSYVAAASVGTYAITVTA